MNDWKQAVKDAFYEILQREKLLQEKIKVQVRPLTPEEAIGNPSHNDYPIIKGRERMIEAEFSGSFGHAFADEFANFEGTLNEVLNLPLEHTRNRAIFISSLNAVLRHLGLVSATVHCRNDEPVHCSHRVLEFFKSKYTSATKIALIGYQPRFAEVLSQHFTVRSSDLDEENIGKEKYGIVVENGLNNEALVSWADVVFATGTVFVSDGAAPLLSAPEKLIFYGVTVSGIAYLLNLQRLCYFGH